MAALLLNRRGGARPWREHQPCSASFQDSVSQLEPAHRPVELPVQVLLRAISPTSLSLSSDEPCSQASRRDTKMMVVVSTCRLVLLSRPRSYAPSPRARRGDQSRWSRCPTLKC